jgi:hypothetical protein
MVWQQEDETGKLVGEVSVPVANLQFDTPKEQTLKLAVKGLPCGHDLTISTQYSSAPGVSVLRSPLASHFLSCALDFSLFTSYFFFCLKKETSRNRRL